MAYCPTVSLDTLKSSTATARPRLKVTVLAPAFPWTSALADLPFIDDQPLQPWQEQLASSLGLAECNGQHLPAAELYRLSHPSETPGNGLAGHNVPLVCADPVCLKPDRDTARLIPPTMLDLSDIEADALLDACNGFLASDGLRFSRDTTSRWFMSGMDAQALGSYPPSFLAHRNASAFMPEGDASAAWRRLMSELQMLLHNHAVNLERELRGRPVVNCVWFWGGAALPDPASLSRDLQQTAVLYADDDYAVTLARHLDVSCQPLQAFDVAAREAHAILVDTRLTDAQATGAEQDIEAAGLSMLEDIVLPLLQRIRSGEPIELLIIDEDGRQCLLDEQWRGAGQTVAGRLGDSVWWIARLQASAVHLWQGLTGRKSGRG